MKTLYIKAHASEINDINIELVEKPLPTLAENECLIKVFASGINASDALASMGYFKHAVLPRTPGRDFTGVVVEGPEVLIGKHAWGTGGAAGISFDGTQAEYIKLPISAFSEVPKNLDLLTASAQPLPYVTAYYSLVKRAGIQANETVLVVGALGQVGRAAMSICQWQQCKAIALVRGEKEHLEATELGWNVINTEGTQLQEKILNANNGKPVQVILNSVGNIYWSDFINVLSEFGRIVTIGAGENTREAVINLFDLYRANQEIIGVNTVSFNFIENACFLNELTLGFDEGKLKPLTVDPAAVYSLEQASQAYKEVVKGTSGKRIIISFN